MAIIFFLLISQALSLNINEELGTFYMSEGEYLNLNLYNYFTGRDLQFTVGFSNCSSGELEIYPPLKFNLTDEIPRSLDLLNLKPPNNRIMSSFRIENKEFLFSFWENNVEIYSLMLTNGDLKLIWTYSLEYQHRNPYIKQISLMFLGETIFAIAVMQQVEEIAGTNVTRNDVYIMNVTNPYEPSDAFLLNL